MWREWKIRVHGLFGKNQTSLSSVYGKQLLDEFWVVNLLVLICLFVHVDIFSFWKGKSAKIFSVGKHGTQYDVKMRRLGYYTEISVNVFL